MQFIHSIQVPNQLIAADGQQIYDMPVNPLSMIYLHISPLNETSTIANYLSTFGMMSAVDQITLAYRGQSIIDMRGQDLLAFIWHCTNWDVCQSNLNKTDNDRRSIVLPICLGRRPYDPNECFPEVRRGELTLSVTWDIADTGFDGLRISIETVEIPEAQPKYFQRVTSLARTFAATGDNDIDLPIGNVIRGVLGFGTTGFAGAAPVPSLGALRLLVDNVETNYASSDWEVLRAVSRVTKNRLGIYTDHIHRFADAAAGEVNTGQQIITAQAPENYVYLDMDPTGDDLFSLETRGKARVHIRANAETADAVRLYPIERIQTSEFLAAKGVLINQRG